MLRPLTTFEEARTITLVIFHLQEVMRKRKDLRLVTEEKEIGFGAAVEVMRKERVVEKARFGMRNLRHVVKEKSLARQVRKRKDREPSSTSKCS